MATIGMMARGVETMWGLVTGRVCAGVHAGAERAAYLSELVDDFLRFKHSRVLTGELNPRTYDGYKRACGDLLAFFGRSYPPQSLRPADFGRFRVQLAGRLGPIGLGTHIRMIRTLFSWAYDNELIERPVRYGGQFDQPSQAACRRVRRVARSFEAAELRTLITAAAGTPMHALILLGINCAYGQTDCAELPAAVAWSAVSSGLLDFDRPKTCIERQAVLWPETIAALRQHARTEGLAFLTQRGNPWVRPKVHRDDAGRIVKVTAIDSLGAEFNKLCDLVRVPRRGFYALRRTFRTVADETGDFNAAARVMGHLIPGVAGLYIDKITRPRLQAVADHVRGWLFE